MGVSKKVRLVLGPQYEDSKTFVSGSYKKD